MLRWSNRGYAQGEYPLSVLLKPASCSLLSARSDQHHPMKIDGRTDQRAGGWMNEQMDEWTNK